MKIDVHSHIEILEVFDMFPEKLPNPAIPRPGDQAYEYKMEMVRKTAPQATDPERKVADLKEMGLDIAILSIAPTQFLYFLDPDQAARACRFENDRMASIARKYPGKLAGMAAVPLQDVEAAVAELARAVEQLGLVGVEIGTNVNGALLGDPKFLPFFEKARDLDVPVYVHPHNPAGMDRMGDHYFFNVMGFPIDSTLTAGSLIYRGIFDRIPGLKIILSHAGGCLPYIIGRMNHGHRIRPECQGMERTPEEYMKMFYYDTISHGADQLLFLISAVGADHVLLGTDYPFDMGDLNPLKSIEAAEGLSPEERAKIEGENARRLFRL